MRPLLILFVLLACVPAHSQYQLGIFAGTSDYTGDLLDKPYKYPHLALGLTAGDQVSDHFAVRAGIIFGKIEGADEASVTRGFSKRNLSFQSRLSEFSVTGEYNLFTIENVRWTPFTFTGVAVYHYNPYTFDQNKQKVYLKPLSTEGEGLTQYPDRKPYALTRLAIPIGGGFKFALSDRVQVAALLGLRITNNDYLDDVSKTYVDENNLLAARGPEAVALSYRGDEVPGGGQTYPKNGTGRGRSGKLIYTDFYYFSGVHVFFSLGDGRSSFSSGGSYRRKGYGCPVDPR